VLVSSTFASTDPSFSQISRSWKLNSPVLRILGHQPINDLLAHYPITPTLQALNPDALSISLDLPLQVHSPALLARSMTTSQRERLRIDHVRCEVEAADRAGELLFGEVGRVGFEGSGSTSGGRGGS